MKNKKSEYLQVPHRHRPVQIPAIRQQSVVTVASSLLNEVRSSPHLHYGGTGRKHFRAHPAAVSTISTTLHIIKQEIASVNDLLTFKSGAHSPSRRKILLPTLLTCGQADWRQSLPPSQRRAARERRNRRSRPSPTRAPASSL